jgi:Fe(II)/alpha-ketoglutarate-dependent arginine beta-hydroxylase
MYTYSISSKEMSEIKALLASLDTFSHPLHAPDNCDNFKLLSVFAHKLPESLVRFLTRFKYEEGNTGLCLIKGYQVNGEKIGDTPPHWREEAAAERTFEESLFLLLCSALLGDAIGWNTQQDGKIVHDIVPIKGDEYKQVGSSALTELVWHTEEAFHPCRCDYLALLCLKNKEGAGTTFASLHDVTIAESDKKMLFMPHYTIFPDSSHLVGEDENDPYYKGVHEMNRHPAQIPVLFGNYDRPYLCIDPFYMSKDIKDPEAGQALNRIIGKIDNSLQTVHLEAGDLLIIDNYRVVHGRTAFNASYDGTGRWLKRVNIVRDLRKSSALRRSFESRIIETA